MLTTGNFPRQSIPYSQKNNKWRKACIDWAKNMASLESGEVRKSVSSKKINYNLVNGKVNMNDMANVINPYDIDAGFISKNIRHYPIMNAKLNVLRGEESRRVFDYRVVITNPNAITEAEEKQKNEYFQSVMKMLQAELPKEEFEQKSKELAEYMSTSWQDTKEITANYLISHYSKELNFGLLFNNGFMDALIAGEEIYLIDIVSGEPVIEKLDPLNVRVFKSSNSNKIEDADIVVIEDFWSPSKIIDVFYDNLPQSDIKKIEYMGVDSFSDDSRFDDERKGFVAVPNEEGFESGDAFFSSLFEGNSLSAHPYMDADGNIRVLRVFWKSKRKLLKVTSINQENGEEEENLFPETHIIDESLGEKSKPIWVNEAWEGTLVGDDIYVNVRPRQIQYNRIYNPSLCHFGIIGSIYNVNGSEPMSMVDTMKGYNYLYDVVHDRLNKLLASNMGKLINLDLAKVPQGWDIEKWMYFAKINNIAVIDSFREGNIGAATGKLAGGLNNAHSGVIDAELGNSIQFNIQLLEFIKNEMSDAAGISRQREGQIFNRETVGGVERANLQSSYITEWLFLIHDDVKKRVIEAFLEAAKIAAKGNNAKFKNILPEGTMQTISIDDHFCECDYGLVLDNSMSTQNLNNKIDMLAQAALQNQLVDFSTIIKMYSSSSMAEKINFIKKAEESRQQQQQQAQEQQQKMQEEAIKAKEKADQLEHERNMELKQLEIDGMIKLEELRIQAQMQKEAMKAELTMELDDSERQAELKEKELEVKDKANKMKFDVEKIKLAIQRQKNEDDYNIAKRTLNNKTTNKKE